MSSSAYRVASLFHRGTQDDEDLKTLSTLSKNVEIFLSQAVKTAPIVMETPGCGDSSTGDIEVQLNVVAGVLEPRSISDDVASLKGIILPTADNHSVLDRRKADEAQAMLNLLGALSNAPTEKLMTSADGEDSAADDDDDDPVVVMDASDLDSDTSDDEDEKRREYAKHSSRIEELN